MTDSQTEGPSSKSLKRLLMAVVLLGGLPLVALLVSHLARPDMPEAWERIHLGMTRAEVIAETGAVLEPDTVDPELELERVVHRGEAWFGEWAWVLKAHFGEDDRLVHGKLIFVSEHFGMMRSERPITAAGKD
jgi:hypothetical protein